LRPLTDPEIRDLEFSEDGGFRFTAELEVRPHYELPEIGPLELPPMSLEVSAAEIDGELVKVAEEQSVWEPAEGANAADGMLIEVDLEGKVEDSEEEPYSEKDASFVLGSDRVPPEINEALQGAAVGDSRTASKTLPEDLEDPAKAGKTVRYEIVVKGLKKKVVPEIDDEIAVEIDESDLRVDTYRSSGAGGQHVNKTDSAVRLTHIPTGIVVQCQNERSQHKNKATAMKVLRAQLYEKQRREQEEKLVELTGEKREIGFGNQIRSYTLHPQQRAKDHRTDKEVGNVAGVLDGDLDPFVRAMLLHQSGRGSAS